MRKVVLILTLVIATAATPALYEPLAPPTAQAATLPIGAGLSAGTTVMNSRKKHKKFSKKHQGKNRSNSKHRT